MSHTGLLVVCSVVWSLCALTCVYGTYKLCTMPNTPLPLPPKRLEDKAVSTADFYVEMV